MKDERVIPVATLFKRLENAQRAYLREELLRREAESHVREYRDQVSELRDEIKSLRQQVRFYKYGTAAARKGKEGG